MYQVYQEFFVWRSEQIIIKVIKSDWMVKPTEKEGRQKHVKII